MANNRSGTEGLIFQSTMSAGSIKVTRMLFFQGCSTFSIHVSIQSMLLNEIWLHLLRLLGCFILVIRYRVVMDSTSLYCFAHHVASRALF